MRPILKGGQWKNSEDEVLKAAVMKYGMNNWSRVASLLNRKTARQCRARWYEWLDPFVKKTPWSQQEDEKLLHAVKVFPTQWKTIAPIVGRTAYQCVARYNELLDIAAGGESIAPENDPRLPKPGEIDAQPETRPAKADAVDLDDDEREMLAEARARLANTKGKKAKRKAREKQLEQKRRSVMVQRRKEFEEAGITLKPRRGRGSNVDYNNVIPNQMLPLPGAHDVSAEQSLSQEGEAMHRRLQDIEAAKERLRQQKLRADERRLMRKIHPTAAQEESLVDIFSIKQRSALTLPAPHATDAELLMIAEATKNSTNTKFFSETLTQSTMTKSLVAREDPQMSVNPTQTEFTRHTPTISEAVTNGLTDTHETQLRVEPLDLAELLGDMNLYIGSKYSVQMAVEPLEERDTGMDEIDDNLMLDRRVRERVRQLSQIHRRYLMLVERLPRPIDLPTTVEEILSLMERNALPLNGVESEINLQAAKLMLADHQFLDPTEYQRILSTRDSSSEDIVDKLKSAFLLHAHSASLVTNVKALKQAVIELDETLDDFSSSIPVAVRDLSPRPEAGSEAESGSFSNTDDSDLEVAELDGAEPADHDIFRIFTTRASSNVALNKVDNPARVCAWNSEKSIYEFVRGDDPLIADSLRAEIGQVQTKIKNHEKRNTKLNKRLEKLTLGYKQRVADAIATLDRVYEYDLEQYRSLVIPALPKAQCELPSV